MGRLRSEAGFTLIELLVVVGIVVVVVATLGVFFLAGPSPAVAAATRDIDAAFAEARETAIAFSEATVVFTPAGSGYSARVYREMPGDAEFRAVNGPTYDSTVTIAETAAPLGAPGFAFRIDRRGTVTGYQHFTPSDTTFTTRSCPTTGAFTLALAYGKQQQTVTIPCTLSVSSVTAGATVQPAVNALASPYFPGTCPPTQPCVTSQTGLTATCPPGYTADGSQSYVCTSPTPTPTATPTSASTSTPTCPPNESGTYPNCAADLRPSPTPLQTSSPVNSGATSTPCPAYFIGTTPNCIAAMVEEINVFPDQAGHGPGFVISLYADGVVCDSQVGCNNGLPSPTVGFPYTNCGSFSANTAIAGEGNSFPSEIPFYINSSPGLNALVQTDEGNAYQEANDNFGSNDTFVDWSDGWCAGWTLPT